MKAPSLEEPAVSRVQRTPDCSSRRSCSPSRWSEKNPAAPWWSSPASRPSTETLSRFTMSNSLLTDGWALPVSIWDRALALIPRRLAVSRSDRPWRRRSARRLPPRSRSVMPASVPSGAYCSPSLDTRYAPARHPGCSTPEEECPMADRLLLRGGTVLTVDPDLGDLPTGDVLVEGDTIAQVAPRIDADAEVIDASGMIVIPGFIDSHRHTWETGIRGCAPNATLDDYFVEVLDTFAPLYRPEDVYASNLAGSLECINAGITTLVDWSHINNSPEHPDAAIRGLQEAGIRAQYAYGSANTSLNDYWNNSKIAIPADDVRRVRDTYFSSGDGLLTLALATRGPTYCSDEVVRAEWGLARELGIPITIHVAMHSAGRFGMVKQLGDLGLLGPDTTYIHCCYLTDDEWRLVADSGGTRSVAPQNQAPMGHGWPPVLKSMEYGLRPSLSIDVVTTAPGDIFTQMRAAFACDRARVNAAAWEAGGEGEVSDTMLTSRQMLEMSTLYGAEVAGVADRTGSLTPGKQADVVVLDATALNMAPVIDPVAAVTNCADVSNVETVLIGGQVRKRDGKLVADAEGARRKVEASRDHLLAELEL